MTKTKSSWWRVRVHETQEEQIFDTRPLALKWCEKVCQTFGEKMSFDLIEVIEKTEVISIDY
jgi:hypothetical protein